MRNYKNVLKNMVNKNKYNVVNLGNGNVRLRYRKNKTGVTVVNVNPANNEPNTMYIGHGRTRNNFRRKGIGTQMRALVTLAAKLAGYKRMRQYSTNLNKKNKTSPSASSRIMNRLGFIRENPFGRTNQPIGYVFHFNWMNNTRLKNASI